MGSVPLSGSEEAGQNEPQNSVFMDTGLDIDALTPLPNQLQATSGDNNIPDSGLPCVGT